MDILYIEVLFAKMYLKPINEGIAFHALTFVLYPYVVFSHLT